jgi:hypothetical protein
MTTHNLGADELLALLRDPSLKPESIVEEMECAGCAPPSTAQVSRVREVLGHIAHVDAERAAGLSPAPAGETSVAALAEEIRALPEVLAIAATHAAGQASRSDLLSALATAAPKPIAKEAKRELQRLKQKGVQIPELKQQGEAVLKPLPEAEAPSCYASSIDAYGERAVWWSRAAKGGVEVVQAVISDIKGVIAIDALALSRRSFREFVKRLPRQGVVTTAELPRDHARWLIAQAEHEGTRNGFSPPESYGGALRLLGPAPAEAPPHPADGIDFGADGELPHALAGAALFQDPLFMPWIPEEEPLRSFAARADEIAASQLYLDKAQKLEAFERAADEVSESYFRPPRHARYARRLMEMAHVLAAEQRIDAARTALAAARQLLRGEKSPFAKALFTHALEGRFDEPAPAAEPPAPLIVP